MCHFIFKLFIELLLSALSWLVSGEVPPFSVWKFHLSFIPSLCPEFANRGITLDVVTMNSNLLLSWLQSLSSWAGLGSGHPVHHLSITSIFATGRCEVYGDPHYITFQGTTYDFLENCTYTLVQERLPEYDFSIVVDNYFCIPWLAGSCTKGIMMKFRHHTVSLSILSSESRVEVCTQHKINHHALKIHARILTTVATCYINNSINHHALKIREHIRSTYHGSNMLTTLRTH